jgi:hypothetical protein
MVSPFSKGMMTTNEDCAWATLFTSNFPKTSLSDVDAPLRTKKPVAPSVFLLGKS